MVVAEKAAVATAEGVVATAVVATAAGAVAVAATAAGAVTPTAAAAGPIPATGRTVAAAAATVDRAQIPAPAVRTVATGLEGMPMAAATMGGALRGATGTAMPAAMRVRAMATPVAGSATRYPKPPPRRPMRARGRRRRPASVTSARP